MIITHIFKSRNVCIIHIPRVFLPGYSQFRVEWERPPSRKDLREYRDVLLPTKIRPEILKAVQGSVEVDEPVALVYLDRISEAADAIERAERN